MRHFGEQSIIWAKISARSVLGTVLLFLVVATMQPMLGHGISLGAVAA